MKRKIIHIDQNKCNGCGACASACHEGAIGMKDGKAVLLRDDYCDGLGDCLPACPTEAITFEEREAAPYNEAAVTVNKQKRASKLQQWPVQIKLMPISAPYYKGAELLIAADCTAFTYANFHNDFMQGKITVMGCSKLDAINYSEKLSEILKNNDIKAVHVVRMEVPCCGGMEVAAKKAISISGKQIPCKVTVISTEGSVI